MPKNLCIGVRRTQCTENTEKRCLLFARAVVNCPQITIDATHVGNMDGMLIVALYPIGHLRLRKELLGNARGKNDVMIAWFTPSLLLEFSEQGGDGGSGLWRCRAVDEDSGDGAHEEERLFSNQNNHNNSHNLLPLVKPYCETPRTQPGINYLGQMCNPR